MILSQQAWSALDKQNDKVEQWVCYIDILARALTIPNILRMDTIRTHFLSFCKLSFCFFISIKFLLFLSITSLLCSSLLVSSCKKSNSFKMFSKSIIRSTSFIVISLGQRFLYCGSPDQLAIDCCILIRYVGVT